MKALCEVIFQGGLGNQMFQYAFFLFLRNQGFNVKYNTSWYNSNECHNGYELEKVFGIDTNNDYLLFNLFRTVRKLNRLHLNMPWVSVIHDSIPSFFQNNFNTSFLTFFDGYWQSYHYIQSVEKSIRKRFCFNEDLLTEETLHLSSVIKSSQTAISIHVRCGDYLSEKFSPLYGGICTPEYYSKAIKMAENKLHNPKFFVFSNDLEWVSKHIDLPHDATFVSCNTGINSWQDMYLMSCCKHNIIANSSFSWWGAWLNDNPNKLVISPSRFVNIEKNCELSLAQWAKI